MMPYFRSLALSMTIGLVLFAVGSVAFAGPIVTAGGKAATPTSYVVT